MLENIGHVQQTEKTLNTHKNFRQESSAVSSSSENGRMSISADRITLQSESTAVLTYSESMTLNSVEDSKYSMLQDLVTNLLKEQGVDTQIAIGESDINLNTITPESDIDLNTITPEEAQELVSDDGYFGVEQTSDRIFQFAVGIGGGDPSRIDAIKEGIDKGFNEALKAFGGELPDISYNTYDAVMEKLDNWVAESQAATDNENQV